MKNVPKPFSPILRPEVPQVCVDPTRLDWQGGLLIRVTNWLGDALMTLPAVHRLGLAVPEGAGLFLLCPDSLRPLWEAAPWVTAVIPMAGKRCGAAETAAIRRLRPGVAVVLPNAFGAAWDVFGKGIPVRIGRAGRGRSPLLTHRLRQWPRGEGIGTRHQLSYYLELAAVFGPVTAGTDYPALVLRDAAAAAGALGIDATAGPWLAMAPGAAYGPAKQWPVERFAAVAHWWRAKGGRVAVVGTAAEREAGEVVETAVSGTVNLAGRTDLHGLMAVLRTCGTVLANDSGAMHLGAALGCRGVAVFGSTDPVATGPIGGTWILLSDPPGCSPCLRRTCRLKQNQYACLARIQVQDAIAALEALPSMAT